MAAVNRFSNDVVGTSSPSTHQFPIAPSDSIDMAYVTRSILASADCTISYIDSEGSTLTGFPLQKGYNPIMASRVLATGTTLGGATLFGLV